MAQIQGNSSTSGGRLDGSIGTTYSTADSAVVLGAGWGGTASFAVLAGSTDQRGQIAVTASASTPAQATATITITFKDGAYASTPFAYAMLISNTQGVTELAVPQVAVTTTTLTLTYNVLPVATKVYTFRWLVVA